MLFKSRAKAIDRLHGFLSMEVCRPQYTGDSYLVISHWENEQSFHRWRESPEFGEGHRRGFEDVKRAKEAGEEPPMVSTFRTYDVIAS
jgi:heme-degrading monooxygenase HmoA